MRGLVSILVLAVALTGVGCRGSGTSPPNREGRTTTISGYGITMALPPGWDGRVYRLSPKYAITLQAATVPLPPPGEDGTKIARRMKSGDAYLVIDDLGPPPPGLGRDRVWDLNPKLPLAITGHVIQGPWTGGFPSGTSLAVVINERSLMIRVRFGSQPGEAEIDEINALLATLSVGPET